MKAVLSKAADRILTTLLSLTVLSALLPACAPTATIVPTSMESEIETEEEAVYAAAFDELYGEPRMYVLVEKTSPSIQGLEGLDSILALILPQMTGMDETTADNFRVRNNAEDPVRPDMELGLPYVVLTDAEFKEIFAINTSGWDIFYTRFPNSPGLTTISQVGFNEELTQALVYVGTISHWLSGVGYYVLLEKTDGTWQVVQQVSAWVS
jgi:hypothetical protein